MWLSIVGLTLALRFTFFLGATSEARFQVGLAYMLGTWLPIMMLNLVEGRRLLQYLKIHHYQKWEELTYIPGFGPGGRNSFRVYRWLRSPEDFGDPVVAIKKSEHRQFIRFVMTVFFSYLILLPLLSV
ncbi:MAG: hypothetical protein P4N60_07420 [Verrucomicrobiae bacterium]|nr:hypothetical protein [Verrucomicrobiae bacterium]